MNRRTLVRQEAVANLRSNVVLTIVTACLAFSLAVGSLGIAAWDAGQRAQQWKSLEDAGRSVIVVTGDVTTVPAALCDSARAMSAVTTSGGIISRDSGPSDLVGSPLIDVLTVTPGFAALAFDRPAATLSGVIAPPDLVARFGLTVGRTVEVAHVEYTVAAATAASTRVEGINDTLIVVAPPTGFVERCYVALAPESRSSGPRAVAGWFGEGYSTAPLLDLGVSLTDPDVAFQTRVGLWICAAAGVVLVGLQCLLWYSRRGEFALYRVLKMNVQSVMLMQCWEFTLAVVVPFCLGAVIGSAFLIGAPPIVALSGTLSLLAALGCLAVAVPIGSLVTLRAKSIDVLKGS